MNRRFQDLNLSNYFLFAAAAEDEETSQLLIETLLGVRIGRVKVRIERSMMFSSDFRSLRLDVYLSDEAQVQYNLEMENRGEEELPKRSRFHQAQMDVLGLRPGEEFAALKPVYVVFICTFDPFGKGLYRYTFENRCLERDFALGDEAVRVFLSTKGTNDGEVPEELVNLLHYLEDTTDAYVGRVDDPNVRKLHGRVAQLKQDRDMEAQYMLFEELIQRERKDAAKETTERILRLTVLMVGAGEGSQIERLEREPEFLDAMLEKYHL